jgi:uncharacterized membrane protein
MKLKPFLQSLFTSMVVLGGIYGLVTFGTESIFHLFVIILVVLFTTIVLYDLFDKDPNRRDHT